MNRTSLYHALKAVLPISWFLGKTKVGIQVRKIYKYAGWFGVIGGLRLYFREARLSREPVKLAPSALPFPIYLRGGTSDAQVYVEVVVERAYDFGLPDSARFIVDAGANIGLTSLFLANRFPQATIVAVEPSGSNMDLLRRNIEPYPRVHAKLAGLWPVETPLRIVNADDEAWGFKVESCEESQASMKGITVAGLLREFSFTRIDILKIDIEGAEWPLFYETDPAWLSSVDCIVMELHDMGARDGFAGIIALIESHGLTARRGIGNNYCFTRHPNSAS